MWNGTTGGLEFNDDWPGTDAFAGTSGREPRCSAVVLGQGRRGLYSARLVSAADKLHNARSILRDLRAEGGAVWRRFTGTKKETLWYYRALVDAFGAAGGLEELVGELDEVVGKMESEAA